MIQSKAYLDYSSYVKFRRKLKGVRE
jgi:hypothetical protein